MKRVISGLAALGIALSGMALGTSSAWADTGGGESVSGEVPQTAKDATATITITNAGGDEGTHEFGGFHLGWFYGAATDAKAEAGFTYQMETDPAHTSEIEAAMKEVKDDTQTDKSLYDLYSQDGNYFVGTDNEGNNPMGWIMANVSDKTTGDKTQLTDWSKQDSTALRQLANALKKKLTNPEYTTAEGKTPLQSSSTGYQNTVNQGYYLLFETTDLASTDAGETASTATPSKAKSTQSIPILVASTIPEAAMLNPTTDKVNSDKVGKVTLKSSQPQIAKQVVDASGKSVTKPDYNIGDDIYYELTTTIPDYTSYTKCTTYTADGADCRKLIVTDTAEKGLTIQGVKSVKVGDATLGTDKYISDISNTKVPYDGNAVSESNPADATKTTIDLGAYVNSDDVADNYGKTVTIIVKAKLNKDAKISTPNSTVPNKNKVSLTYSNKFDNVSDAKTIPGGEVNVYTFKFKLNKTAMDGTTPITGAQFKIQKKDGSWLKRTTDGTETTKTIKWEDAASEDEATAFIAENGTVEGFDGLEAGTYTVKETKAADGYTNFSLPSFDITIGATYDPDTSTKPAAATTWGDHTLTTENINLAEGVDSRVSKAAQGDAASFTINVKNAKNLTELPMTGGAGLVAIIAVGVLLAGAGTAAAVRSRKSNSRAVRV